jgi:hypothetical protein
MLKKKFFEAIKKTKEMESKKSIDPAMELEGEVEVTENENKSAAVEDTELSEDRAKPKLPKRYL